MDEFRRSVAVVIGIDRYCSGIPQLGSARRDAERLGSILRDQHGYEVRSYLDEDATGEQMLRALTQDLAGDLGPEDRLFFYFAGHGVALDGDGGVNGYLLPADAKRGQETSFLHMPRVQLYALWRLDAAATAERLETGEWAALTGEFLVTAPSSEHIFVRKLPSDTAGVVAEARPPFQISGQWLAAIHEGGGGAVWNLADPAHGPVIRLEGTGEPIEWGGAGNWLATYGAMEDSSEPPVQFWLIDTASGETSLQWSHSSALFGALDEPTVSGDGRWWLTLNTRGPHLLAFDDLRSDSSFPDLPAISAHAWAPEGGLLATGHADGSVRAWNVSGDSVRPVQASAVAGPGEIIWMNVSAGSRWVMTQHPARLILWRQADGGFAIAGDLDVTDLDQQSLDESLPRAALADLDRVTYQRERQRPPLRFGKDGATVRATTPRTFAS